MNRKIQFSLVATTAIAAVLSNPAYAQQSRPDGGSSVSELENPTYDANTSLGVVTGDNLGNHIADGELNMNGFAVFNMGDPIDPMDGVSLRYLENYVEANGDNLGNHTATKVLNMGGFAITQLPAPTGPTEAANRAYVDTAVAGAGDDLGDHTATENLNMNGHRITRLQDPENAKDAVPLSFLEQYVDDNGDNLGNHTATRDLDMKDFKILNLMDPTDDKDAANKLYVDGVTAGIDDRIDDLEAIEIIAGTGLSGGGDLTQSRTISFSTTWGDGRYALRTRSINAGTGLTGGGNLAGNRTIALNLTYGDDRWINRTANVSISGTKTFTGPVIVNTPTADNHAVNKGYVDDAADGAIDSLIAGDGLTKTGRTFAVDSTVVRTSGNQTINGVKTLGQLRHYDESNESNGSIRFGRNANQYLDFHGGSDGNFVTSVSPESYDKPLVLRVQNGALEHNFRFSTDGQLGNIEVPTDSKDAANKAYVDAAAAAAIGTTYTAGTGLNLAGTEFSFNTAFGDGRYALRGRNMVAGDGLTGGGTLAANRTFAVDSSVVRTSRSIATGTGLSGGGSLGANRTLSFNITWGDGRYALRSRTLIAGTGLTGGGNLGANRSFAFDTTWGDKRYAEHSDISGSTNYDSILGGTATSGARTFHHSEGGAPADAPTVQQQVGMRLGSPWGRTDIAFPNDNDVNRGFFRTGTSTNWAEFVTSENIGSFVAANETTYTAGTGLTLSGGQFNFSTTWGDARYALRGRTITAGDGLTGGGTLAANRTFAVDNSVVRTSRSIATGAGLTGGGNLSANRTFAVDNTVFRTGLAVAGNLRFANANGLGMRFFDNDNYKIYMSAQADATWGGRLDTASDYNMYFRMGNGTTRGFVFKNGNDAIFQIGGDGRAYSTGGYRSSGDTGWYNETHGGGWYMQDSTWLRSYNNKNIFTGGKIRADNGVMVGSTLSIDSNGLLNAGNLNIINVATPTAGTHAANKAYVDAKVSAQPDADTTYTAGTGLVESSQVFSFDTAWGDGRYALRGRTLTAGDGLTGGGTLAANRTFAVDSSVVRTLRSITAGTGLTGGGNLGANRSLAFDTTWGDARYALRGRAVNTGTGLTGGGNLTANRTISVDGTVFRTGAAIGGNLRFSAGNGLGMRFFDNDNYKIYMSAQADATWGGRLDTASDYNMYFRMAGGSTRGFVFKNGTTPVFQIAGNGLLLGNNGRIESTQPFVTTNTNGFRMVNGNYASFWRQDGSNMYLMLTDSGDQYGGWNSLRPFFVNMATGLVYMRQGLDMGAGRIRNVASPSASTDAANKAYVDNKAETAYSAGTGISISGTTINFNTTWGDGRYALRDRDLTAGDGLTGGGTLAANRTFAVDSSVVRTSRSIAAGTGLSGGGNLGANRTLSFNTTWGDARYALRGRSIAAGTGLTGGGDLAANRTISFNTTWGDARYMQIEQISNSSYDDLMGGTTTAQAQAFYHSMAGAPSDAPMAAQIAGMRIGTPWGRTDLAFPNSGTTNRAFFRTGTSTAWSEIITSDNIGSMISAGTGLTKSGNTLSFNATWGDGRYAQRGRTIATGSGLTGGGNLAANRTIAVDGTVIRTTGDQSMAGVKTMTGELRVLHDSNTPDTKIRFGRSTIQYMTFHGGDSGNYLTSVSPAENAKALRLRVEAGTVANDFVFSSNGILSGLSNPISGNDAATKLYVDGAYAAGTGLTKSGTTLSFNATWGDGRYALRGRALTAGDGLTGGGTLAANRTFAVDSSVVRTSRSIAAGTGLSGGGNLGANRTLSFNTTWGDARYALRGRSIAAGTGLTGGGDLAADRTIALANNYIRRTAGSASAGLLAYNGTTSAAGQLYGGSTNPTSTTRLNYNGSLYATRFYSNAYYYFSDRNLKKDIETIDTETGMGIVRDLRPVSYAWRENDQKALGVIAQEVEEVMPTAVTTNEAGIKAVDYTQMIAPMLAAIQELDERVQALEEAAN